MAEQKRIIVCTTPRTLSTAFTRAMMSRNSCKVCIFLFTFHTGLLCDPASKIINPILCECRCPTVNNSEVVVIILIKENRDVVNSQNSQNYFT